MQISKVGVTSFQADDKRRSSRAVNIGQAAGIIGGTALCMAYSKKFNADTIAKMLNIKKGLAFGVKFIAELGVIICGSIIGSFAGFFAGKKQQK